MLIGITGGIGSGKSTICRALEKAGYAIYDTDSRAKEIVVNDPEVRAKMVALFGEDIYDEDVYFASKVAARVFAQPELLQQLNQIVHPAVLRDLRSWAGGGASSTSGSSGTSDTSRTSKTSRTSNTSPLFVESALLFSSHINELCSLTVWIDAPLEVRIARTIRRDGTDRERVLARIAAQKNEADLCDLVLYNDGVTPVRDLLHRLETHIQSLHAVG